MKTRAKIGMAKIISFLVTFFTNGSISPDLTTDIR